ncbi:MAG: MaoC family dehydratase N-terminal domain-containing protein [Pseudomonadota bacterium]
MLPEEITKLIGKSGEPIIYDVERGAIRKFADCIGDRNPLIWDDEYARNSKYGSVVAPPGFFGWPVKWDYPMPFVSAIRDELIAAATKAGYSRIVDGGIEFEFFSPVRAGDTLVVVTKVSDIYAKETKGNTLVFSVTETSYTNQDGILVGLVRQTLINR